RASRPRGQRGCEYHLDDVVSPCGEELRLVPVDWPDRGHERLLLERERDHRDAPDDEGPPAHALLTLPPRALLVDPRDERVEPRRDVVGDDRRRWLPAADPS